jgi:hypothetical protein
VKASALGNSAADLLAAIVEAIEAINPAYPLPGARYVGAGEVPWDGPGLYIYLGGGHTGQPGQPIATNVVSVSAVVRTAMFYVQLIREVSTFGYLRGDWRDIPTDADLNTEGVQAINDAGMLVAAATRVKKDAIIVANEAGFVIGQVMPIGPDGGLAAMRLQLDLSVDAT